MPIGFLCADDTIPIKFHRVSGVRDYAFRIRNRYRWRTSDTISAWPFQLLRDNSWVSVEAPIARFAAQVESMAILSALDGETERAGRYINVHSAYEAVASKRKVHLSAVRHALAHPITSLTREAVVASLRSQFGASRIDLGNYSHQKVIYCNIGEMLIAIEKALFSTFSDRFSELLSRS